MGQTVPRMNLDETHDPALRSFVASANAPDGDFPIQNLPYAVFRRRGESPRVGVAIGDADFDVAACASTLDGAAAMAASACAAPHLNAHDGVRAGGLGRAADRPVAPVAPRRHAPRRGRAPSQPACRGRTVAAGARSAISPIFSPRSFMPPIPGGMFRPDNPLLPNYKHVPVAYHGRASSVRPSGTLVRRPLGQTKRRGRDGAGVSRVAQSRLRVGARLLVGCASSLGEPVPIAGPAISIRVLPAERLVGARHPGFGAQPLGPFLRRTSPPRCRPSW